MLVDLCLDLFCCSLIGQHLVNDVRSFKMYGGLEDQFKPNDYEDDFRDHYKQVRRGVEAFRNTEFESSIKEVTW